MEASIALIVLLILGVPLALAIWLITPAVRAKSQIENLSRRVDELQVEIVRLKNQSQETPKNAAGKVVAPIVQTVPPPMAVLAETPPTIQAPQPKPAPQPQPELVTPRPLPVPPRRVEPQFVAPAPPLAPPKPMTPKINWEQFMGVKGFAWIGGFALFLGVVFAIQYAFAHHLISPELQAACGFATGLGLLVGGVTMSRKDLSVLSQTLCATGVVVLYAVTFACNAHYRFPFFGTIPTFLLMSLITVTAFLLAARLDALVVAILGMLGGFLTPILLATGQDNPLGLFGYIAILDAGLIFVALNKRWLFLTALAALGTAIMQIGWVSKFFEPGKYFEDNKILITLSVLLGFNLLFLAGNWLANRWSSSFSLKGEPTDKPDPNCYWISGSMLGLAALALGFTFSFFDYAPLAERPVLLFSFVFLIDLAVAALTWLDRKVSAAQPIAGVAVFGLLAAWTAPHLTNNLLNAALAFYFIFAVFHSALPAWQQRRRGIKSGVAAQLNHIFPPLALLLVLVPILKLEELSFLVWPFVLLMDLLAIVLAVLTATLFPVLVVLILTLAATGELIFKIPADLTGLPVPFFLLGGFAVFFVIASVWLARRFSPQLAKTGLNLNEDILSPENLPALLPASSAVMPFLLLIMATLRLPLADPSPDHRGGRLRLSRGGWLAS